MTRIVTRKLSMNHECVGWVERQRYPSIPADGYLCRSTHPASLITSHRSPRFFYKLSILMLTVAFFLTLTSNLAFSAPPGPRKSDIQPLNAAEAKALMAQQPKKPRIIAAWSLDCSYCKLNVKQLAAEARKRRSFELVLISVDSIEEAATLTKLQTDLGAQGFKSYASNEPILERFRYAVDSTWGGEMPRTLFIGTDGSRYATSGLINNEVLAKWLAGGK
jgi:hypothetical protein